MLPPVLAGRCGHKCAGLRAASRPQQASVNQLSSLSGAECSDAETPCDLPLLRGRHRGPGALRPAMAAGGLAAGRSEEHTSELQSLMRTSYAFSSCQKKKK